MENILLITAQSPGKVSFDNFEEVKKTLTAKMNAFDNIDYSVDGVDAAVSDRDQLKQMRDIIGDRKKELEKAYSAPYVAVEKMLDELLGLIDGPYKKAKSFVDNEEKAVKRRQIMAYAEKQAASVGEIGAKIINSPAFFKNEWLMKKCSVKNYQDEIDGILQQASANVLSIQNTGRDKADTMMAVFLETLSMDKVKSFLNTLNEEQEYSDTAAIPTENNVVGYKVLKITATEDQMANLLDQLAIMGIDVEEIEDGMPKAMPELTAPNFDSFVAFDIETTGSFGAANGDSSAQITEIGAVRVVNGAVVEKFDELANPGRKIVPRIERLTHITNEMVADKPPVDEVIRMFREFVGDSKLIGHNIKSSDLRYIQKAAKKAGVVFDMPFLDTYLLAKQYKDSMRWEKLNLGYLAEQYGFEHKEVHRAWSDAEVNAQVYFELQRLFEKKR